MSSVEREVPLHPFTVEFVAPEQERAFRLWDQPEHVRRARAVVIVGSAVLLAYGYADYLFFGADRRFAALLVARLVGAALGAVVLAATRAGTPIARQDRLLLLWTAVATATAVAATATRPADYQFHGLNMMIVVLSLYVLVPHRFVHALGFAAVVSVAYAAVVVAGARAAHLYVAVLVLTLVLANSFGIVGGRWIHRVRRTEFLRLENERAVGERLRRELEERARIEARLVEANRARSLFLATMSHEIRTPLHGILACAELLASSLSGEARESVELIRYSGRGMIQLVDEVLDFSRSEAGALRLAAADFDPRRLVEELAAFVRSRVRAQGLALAVDVDARVPASLRGDASRLRQVLLNLVENAVKFSERGTISVAVAALDVSVEAATLCFAVTDEGPGVPVPLRAAIFEPFVQGPVPPRPVAGSGLGLAICKRIVEAMGGTIALDDAPGGGSRFRVTARFEVGAVDEPRDDRPPTPVEGPRLSLLVVEDDEVSRRMATALLTRAGHEVTLASSGLEAVALVRQRAFDVVLMDIRLPGIDGCAATERIRALPDATRAATPVIATTASVMTGEHERYRAAGVSRVLAKPIEFGALRQALAEVAARGPAAAPHDAPRAPPGDAWIDEALLARHVHALGAATVDAIVALFLETSVASMAALAAAVHHEDAARVAHEAHRLASAAESAGARRCAADAARLERAAAADARGIPEAFATLERTYAESVTRLRAWSGQRRSTAMQ